MSSQKEAHFVYSVKLKGKIDILFNTLQKHFKLNTIVFETLPKIEQAKLAKNFGIKTLPCIIIDKKLVAQGNGDCYNFCGIKPTVLTTTTSHGKKYASSDLSKQPFLQNPPPADYVPPKLEDYPNFVIPTTGLLGQRITSLAESTNESSGPSNNLWETKQNEREKDESFFSQMYQRT